MALFMLIPSTKSSKCANWIEIEKLWAMRLFDKFLSMSRSFESVDNDIGVGDRGAGGLQPSHLWKILQKSAIIGQKIALKSGRIFANNGSFIGQPP